LKDLFIERGWMKSRNNMSSTKTFNLQFATFREHIVW